MDLNHWSISASTQTFDFLNGKHIIRSCLSIFNTKVLFAGFNNFLRTSKLAWSCSTNLKMIFSNSFSIEHCVKWGDLINVHFVDFTDFCYCSHGIERKEVIILFLSQMEKRNDGGSFPIWWILIKDFINLFVVILSKIERCWIVIIGSGSVWEVSSREFKAIFKEKTFCESFDNSKHCILNN